MPTLPELQKRREALEAEIAEARRRLPAHSVKPAVMAMLLDLEDAYDQLLEQIERTKRSASG